MTTDEAFKKGLQLVRDDGLPARGSDIPVLAAWEVFRKRASGLEWDARFETQAPRFARHLILIAYASDGKVSDADNG